MLFFLLDLFPEPPVARFNVRRKSVFAETYNPEDDDEDEGTKCIFPKSDEQRARLAESVRCVICKIYYTVVYRFLILLFFIEISYCSEH